MKILLIFTALSLLAQSSFASNSLGNKYQGASITNPVGTKTFASKQITTNYSTHQEMTPAGVTITKYVDNSGTIFAITWNGETLPNLEELLGQYFQSYKDTHRKTLALHSNSVATGDLVVQNSGRLRAFKGVAYLKSALPANFQISEL